MSRAVSRGSGIPQRVELDRGHEIAIDEPEEKGGTDEAATPTELLGAALAACTASTMRMYAERKGWELGELEVEVEASFDHYVPSAFRVVLKLPEGLDEEQESRLRTIAAKCPVHRALAAETRVELA